MKRFKKIFIGWILILVLISFIFIGHFYLTLKNYEENQINNYLLSTINELSKKDLLIFLKEYDLDSNLIDDYLKIVRSNDYEFVKKEDSLYEAILNDRVMFTIEVKVKEHKNSYLIFNYDILETKKITPNLERGFYYYDVIVPSNYMVFIDKEKLEKYTVIEEFKELELFSEYMNVPTLVKYELNELDEDVKITIKDFFEQDVDIVLDNFEYKVDNYFIESEKLIDGIEIDIMKIAQDWSLFLTNDLKGENHGFNTISQYLIKDSDLYQMAYNWAHSVDITFTSRHTLSNPPFTNAKINNYIYYDTSAFSCEVYLEKNMVVGNQKQQDIMHDRFYFVKYNNTWKLINIESIEGE